MMVHYIYVCILCDERKNKWKKYAKYDAVVRKETIRSYIICCEKIKMIG
ncbi:MAG: hypothetical protein ACI90V_013762 [Bacillariaceae sp.]|jgi:hypothetical protein